MGNQPSVEEWKGLYQAAMEFQRLAPWEWMVDSDLFGVKNPVNGEIGYCCVMGARREVFALAVYLGSKGLEGYFKIQSGMLNPEIDDSLHIQKCLMVSFDDRGFVQKEDLQVIKRLGLKFRGKNAWPVFRSFEPGYHPWFLTREETKFLTLALQQAVEVAQRFKVDPDLLSSERENCFLVRVQDAKGNWKDKWVEPPPIGITILLPPLDEKRLKKIKAFKRSGALEVDCFYAPQGVREKNERPFYPQITLMVDHSSGLILDFSMVSPEEFRSALPEYFLSFVEKMRGLPELILVKKVEVFVLLDKLTSTLGAELRMMESLPALEAAQRGMFGVLRKM